MSLVITTLLTSSADPQRGQKWTPTVTMLDDLLTSLRRHDVPALVLHDELPDDVERPGVEFVRVEPGDNPYFHRWAVISAVLSSRCRIGQMRWSEEVWCVDGTDVEMLHSPFGAMVPDALHIGSEPTTLSEPWLRLNHPSVAALVHRHPDLVLYNAGVLGGAAAVVEAFARNVAWCHDPGDLTDMGAINLVAHGWSNSPVISGDTVHTRFRGYDTNHPSAWWRHK